MVNSLDFYQQVSFKPFSTLTFFFEYRGDVKSITTILLYLNFAKTKVDVFINSLNAIIESTSIKF